LCVIYRPPNARVALWNDINLSKERALDVNPNLINGRLKRKLLATSSTLIDPISVSSSIEFYKSGCLVVDNTISDHKLTFTTLN